MSDETRWQDAHVGAASAAVSFRATEQERERLEQLRQDLRLTSRGQVIRAALDLLEAVALGSDTITGKNTAETRRLMRRARRAVGVPSSADLAVAPADDAVAVNKSLKTSFKHVATVEADRRVASAAAAAASEGAG